MAAIQVSSEIKTLHSVLLHRPGRELLNLTPETLDELLFDDIPFLKMAQREHDAFAELLRGQGVTVLYLEDLAAEAIGQNPQIREKFIRQFIDEGNIYTAEYKELLFSYFSGISDNKELILKTMEGVNVNELDTKGISSLVNYVDSANNLMVLNPMPNLYFTRDPFATIGNSVSLNRMLSVTRNRETIYGEYIFNHHPDYAGKVAKVYDRYDAPHIEGGDILNINATTLAVGISERTSANAIDALADNLFYHSDSKIDTVLAFSIPEKRAFMHLDTVFTQIDYDKFTVHPGILGPLQVFEIKKGKDRPVITALESTLEKILEKYTGMDKVELILCAGGDKIASEREQWNDGSNTLCVSPGKIVVYDRNDVTNELLVKKGLKVLEIPSAELSRGRGGPRCMTMPFVRDL